MIRYDRLPDYNIDPDDTHEECLNEDDIKEAREEAAEEARAALADEIDNVIETHDDPARLLERVRAIIHRYI